MEHEISGLDTVIEQQAYRVDGINGIKQVVGLDNRKSVDYFYTEPSPCWFIEFTDLTGGQEDWLGHKQALESIENRFQRQQFAKLVKQAPRDEMLAKFKDSRDIFAKIIDVYDQVPQVFTDLSAKVFIIVHAPINPALSAGDKADIARFLETLKAQLTTCLERDICSRVRLMLVDEFKRFVER
jgi:hypothetical protein